MKMILIIYTDGQTKEQINTDEKCTSLSNQYHFSVSSLCTEVKARNLWVLTPAEIRLTINNQWPQHNQYIVHLIFHKKCTYNECIYNKPQMKYNMIWIRLSTSVLAGWFKNKMGLISSGFELFILGDLSLPFYLSDLVMKTSQYITLKVTLSVITTLYCRHTAFPTRILNPILWVKRDHVQKINSIPTIIYIKFQKTQVEW